MAKLKNIIKQLSYNDFIAIHDSLIENNAEKSALLLKAMRERSVSDNKIMSELEVNTNAYYTLRSRLNQRIEEYLLEQMETPRADVIKKVANINEVIFTQKRAIAIATLKKIEKELLDYDLSNELTVIYKSLKRLHINSPEHFNYSQLYNRHVAYMLAVDKAEDLLAQYFKKYGEYLLSRSDRDKIELDLLEDEMNNTCGIYDSHRLYVYQSCINVFHRLFIDTGETEGDNKDEPVEDILVNMEKILSSYYLDSIYHHLRLVYEFLRLEYYNHYHVFRKAEEFFEDVNDATSTLLTNYSLYTYPARFLFSKLERAQRLGNEATLYNENEILFHDFECDKEDLPKYVSYVAYRSLSCYYAGYYEEAIKWINNMLNEISLKKFPFVQLEIKSLLALQYCILKEYELFNQLINSIQRQMRLVGKESCEYILIFTKILKTGISENKRDKFQKMENLIKKLHTEKIIYFSPISYIKMDENFMKKISN